MDLLQELAALEQAAVAAIQSASPATLFRVEKDFLGRNGKVSALMDRIASLPAQERKSAGQRANAVKLAIHAALAQKKPDGISSDDAFTLSLPATKQSHGTRHPLARMQETIQDIFLSMGYETLYGPEIETAKYNFDLLRIPENHPARDVWDTFYIDTGKKVTGPNVPLLRTHASTMQGRVMEKRTPPIYYISPGRVYRHEATDASHEANFFQCDGLAIDKGLTMGDLLGTLEAFFKALFGEKIELRAQPSYFPFVEPGVEILMKGKNGWMEMLGAGMVHPDVLRSMHVDPNVYSGFAFGMGIDRIMMYYNGVPDVRYSYNGDLRFLEQF